jgi:quercetin dioxygenase-like cupin family protein
MRLKGVLAVLVGLFVMAACAQAQYTGVPGISPAQAQGQMPVMEQGVQTKGLVTSLGAYKQADHIPILLTGMTVTIAPGGHTGRERFLVPSYLYVLEGTLTTDTQGGPTGISGIQYHAEGQSYSSPVGAWHNFMNTGTTPAKYLLLFIGSPGAPTIEKAKADQ